MSQELRNKIYGVIGALGTIALAFGLATAEDIDTITDLLSKLLDSGVEIATTGAALLAFFKSLPSKVTVIEAPRAEVAQAIGLDGGPLVSQYDLDREDEANADLED